MEKSQIKRKETRIKMLTVPGCYYGAFIGMAHIDKWARGSACHGLSGSFQSHVDNKVPLIWTLLETLAA